MSNGVRCIQPALALQLTESGIISTLGDIVSVNLLGQPMVILNSAEIASELLEKRSAIYSDRPTLVMSGEMVGWKNALGLVRYNDKFREYRKFISRKMGTRSQVQEFYELQEVETHTFTRRVLKEPENLAAHIRRFGTKRYLDNSAR